jgi:hypothetical protein
VGIYFFVVYMDRYDSVGDMINAARIVLLDGDNISFDAILVSMNNSSIPPTLIINRM